MEIRERGILHFFFEVNIEEEYLLPSAFSFQANTDIIQNNVFNVQVIFQCTVFFCFMSSGLVWHVLPLLDQLQTSWCRSCAAACKIMMHSFVTFLP
jgi:hypothetical protein